MSMQENCEYVQHGFRVLVKALSPYIVKSMRLAHGGQWQNKVRIALSDQRDLPAVIDDETLINFLDISNCIRLLDRQWMEVFGDRLKLNCRTWAKELMGVRNIVSHAGSQDLDQPTAERALDTMALLCAEVDKEAEKELRALYREVRSKADGAYGGLAQPESRSRRSTPPQDSLLRHVGTKMVRKTTQTRKLTFGGKTAIYPVYRVRLDCLFYNDQNDRIATWISRYEAENGGDSLSGLGRDVYNRVIEDFIVQSNPEAIRKTQANIHLVGQREPGVTLSDGRVVDGNRRFTCLRRMERGEVEPLYFETVLLDMDIQEDKKQIKLLELAIQHGEEKKVEYDPIDFAVGTYRDIVQTKLLTVEEYAGSTGEKPADVKARIEAAKIMAEFLEFIGLPEQYHVAREYQVFSLFQEMMPPLRKLGGEEQELLKKIAFCNVVLKAIPDQRKFIRDIRTLIQQGFYEEFASAQAETPPVLRQAIQEGGVVRREDLDRIASEHQDLREDMEIAMERALQRSRAQKLRAQPRENVSRCMTLLTEIDPRLFPRMDPDERNSLRAELEQLSELVRVFTEQL